MENLEIALNVNINKDFAVNIKFLIAIIKAFFYISTKNPAIRFKIFI